MLNKLLHFAKNHLIFCIGFITLLFFLYAFFIAKKQIIFADGAGYFSYPYQLITKGNLLYEGQKDSTIFGVTAIDKDTNINKYPIGTGLFLTPALIFGEIFRSSRQAIVIDPTYQFFTGIFGIIFLMLGLAVLNRILLRFFNKKTTALTLLTVTFATNLFVYGSTDSSFSHIYSFLCINVFLLFLIKWHELPSKLNTLILALSIGLTILIRHSNITILLLFLLYDLDLKELKSSIINKVRFYKNNFLKLFSIILVVLLVLVPQFVYLLSVTGNIVFFSYGEEGFNFLQPQFWNVLFNKDRGAFLYHPILILVIAGIIYINRRLTKLTIALLSFILINFYIVSSWWFSDYGIGFGHRAFTDFMGIFALLLGCIISSAKEHKDKDFHRGLVFIIYLSIVLNIVLAFRYIYQ